MKSGLKSGLKKPTIVSSEGKGVQFKSPAKKLSEEMKNADIQVESPEKMTMKEEMDKHREITAKLAEENLKVAKNEATNTLEKTSHEIE